MKKKYSTPEVDIEKFLVSTQILTSGLEGSGNEYVGGEDWDF